MKPNEIISQFYSDCTLCPRKCHVNRAEGQRGFCGETATLRAARASLHMWEEPILSGERGSGTVFFTGCPLRCIFCQNYDIARSRTGFDTTPEGLAAIFLDLQSKGAHNINLVTGTHFTPLIREALLAVKGKELHIPVVFNCGGYESVETLKLLEGLVDIYLPDFKYVSSELSARYSAAPDYFDRAGEALAEMVRQVGEPVLGEDGMLQRGVIVRHLILPGQTRDSKKVLRYLHETYGDQIYISIMNQYTPFGHVGDFPELQRTVTSEEYDRVLDFAQRLGISRGFTQEGSAAAESFIPEFDGRGIIR